MTYEWGGRLLRPAQLLKPWNQIESRHAHFLFALVSKGLLAYHRTPQNLVFPKIPYRKECSVLMLKLNYL